MRQDRQDNDRQLYTQNDKLYTQNDKLYTQNDKAQNKCLRDNDLQRKKSNK